MFHGTLTRLTIDMYTHSGVDIQVISGSLCLATLGRCGKYNGHPKIELTGRCREVTFVDNRLSKQVGEANQFKGDFLDANKEKY